MLEVVWKTLRKAETTEPAGTEVAMEDGKRAAGDLPGYIPLGEDWQGQWGLQRLSCENTGLFGFSIRIIGFFGLSFVRLLTQHELKRS